MVREALFLLDPIEIGFEKAWVINLLVRFIRFVQKHVENKILECIRFEMAPNIPSKRNLFGLQYYFTWTG